MRTIFAIAFKDIRLIIRDKGAAFFTFLFPLAIAIFFGAIFAGGGDSKPLDVVLVNEDGGEASVAFANDLSTSDGLKINGVATRAEGELAVRKGRAVACIVLPKDFQDRADNPFAGKPMTIEGIVDPAHKAEAGLLTGKLNEVAFRRLSGLFSGGKPMKEMIEKGRRSLAESAEISPQRRKVFGELFTNLDEVAGLTDALNSDDGEANKESSVGGWKPIEISVTELSVEKDAPRNTFELSFPQGVVWGLMGCVMAFGTSLTGERARGTLMRLTTSPATKSQILLGKAAGCLLTCLIVQVLLIAMGVSFFHVHVRQPILMAVAMLCSAFGFVGVMMLMAGLSRTEGAAQGMGRAVMILLAMVGGGTVPLVFLPKSVQSFSSISPFKWTTIVTEGAIWRGFTLADMLFPCAVLLMFGIGGFAIGVWAFRWSESN